MKFNFSAKVSNIVFLSSLVLVFLIFGVVFSLSSIVPDILYRTNALDLGMFNHALYSYAHLKSETFTLALSGIEIPDMGNHFAPLTMLYGPFYYLFGEYSLLIIQIIAILAGGYGVFRYSLFKGINRWLSLLLTIHFFTIWGIYSALSFDFHNNVIAAMLLPWFIYFFDKGKFKWVLCFYFLIIFAKENMALWMTFILLALLIRKEGNPPGISKRTIAILAFCTAVYFIVVIEYIMPSLTKGLTVGQLSRYEHLGDSVIEIITNLWRKPEKFFVFLFEDTFKYHDGLGVKSQLHFFILASGGIAFFRKPHFLVMLIPIYAQKFLTSEVVIWSIKHQYSIEFVPVISLAVISLVQHYKETKWSWAIVAFFIYTSVHFNERNLFFLQKEHYVADVNVEKVNALLKLVPDSAIVTADGRVAPHLSFREKIYHYPVIKDAEYIVLLKKGTGYPLTNIDFMNRIDSLKVNPEATILADNEDLIIAKIPASYAGRPDL